MSIAHLKELFAQVVILEIEYEQALKNLKEMARKIQEEPEVEPGQVGFVTSQEPKDAPTAGRIGR